MKQTKKYPAPQISEAVFRGRNALYNFEVYPMNVQFNEVPAVYIISKRKIDRNGKGHHFLVCIGQTESLVEDIKKHKRGRCVKQLQANTVSVILEDDEKKRLEVENDLKSAHTIPCHHDAADEEFGLKPIVKPAPPKVKIEVWEKAVPPPIEISSKSQKKPLGKQIEAKADLPKTKPAPKEQIVGKKPETVKSAKAVEPKKKAVNKKIETKAQTAKVFAKSQKTEASKAKQTPPKVTKTTVNQKIEVSKPKKASPAKLKAEKKQSSPKIVPALKKSTVNQAKSKTKSKVKFAKPRSGAPKIDRAKVNKAKITKAKTVETPKKAKKIAEKITTEKSPKAIKSAKTTDVKKTQGKIKISGKAKIEPKTSKPKTSAKTQTVEPKKIKQSKTAKITKPEKLTQTKTSKIVKPEKVVPVKSKTKAKAKTESPKLKQANGSKIKANTKTNTGIKPRIKGKENRLKSSPRKRLAF